MKKAGGIISIVAGVLGALAALFTLLMGGVVSAGNAAFGSNNNDDHTIYMFGLFGLLFSFLIIVFGAIGISAQTRKSGIVLVILSLLGIVMGGTPVAICLSLSLLGGILCAAGIKPVAQSSGNSMTQIMPIALIDPISSGNTSQDGLTLNQSSQKKKTPVWGWILAAIFGLFVISIVAAPENKMSDTRGAETTQSNTNRQSADLSSPQSDNTLDALRKAVPADIASDGKLADIFNLGSNYTDLQREDTFNQIKGKVVAWTLPVYEVSRVGDQMYKIQTGSGQGNVGVFVYIITQNADEIALVKQLKTGDEVNFKGVINDVEFRNLVIKPAILSITDKSTANQ